MILWRGLATLANQYVRKGSLLYIEGRLQHRQFEEKDGAKKYITEVVADQIVLLDKKPKSAGEPESNEISGNVVPF